jgi:hypothetical protein
MAEPDNFDTRDRAHISIDVFRETAAYTFPSRNQERNLRETIRRMRRSSTSSQRRWGRFRLPLPTRACPYRG